MPQIPSGRDLILACVFRASARASRAILRAIHALHFSFSLECHQGSPSHPVAQSIPALAHRDLYGREDDADRFSGVLAFHLAGAPPSVAILEVDWRDGAVRASESEKLVSGVRPQVSGLSLTLLAGGFRKQSRCRSLQACHPLQACHLERSEAAAERSRKTPTPLGALQKQIFFVRTPSIVCQLAARNETSHPRPGTCAFTFPPLPPHPAQCLHRFLCRRRAIGRQPRDWRRSRDIPCCPESRKLRPARPTHKRP
jgi:hypothetical protein